MQEFWVTVSRHHSSLHFKLNGKSHTVNIDNFRDMLKIYPKLPAQIFEEPPLEEEILSFIYRDLGHTGGDKFLSDSLDQTKHAGVRSYMNLPCLNATSEKTLKPKSTKKKADSKSSPKTKLTQVSKGKRIKTVAKGDKPAKRKQSVTKSKGLTVLSERLSEEEDDDEVNMSKDNDNDVDKDDEDDDADNQDDEILDDANQDDDDEQTDSDNDGDDFVHPKLSTHMMKLDKL
ncbi:hypothetical protein Tco_1413782 [Tanacetum coccineum]